TDPVINEHLGDVYWVVGRKIEARYQWERALGFKPEEDRLPGLEERLRCGLDSCDGRTPGAASAAKDGTRGAQ
ncbi:MAG: tetratricopeptide repeat protein, partial [Alphaproteobacteria bacterium]